jgi:DNA-binding MarR family transcriptional regulator
MIRELWLGLSVTRFEHYRDLERQTKVRLLTCEAEILFNLARSPHTAGELQALSKNSSTSFYMTLKKLHQMKLIIGVESKEDRRRVVYQLAEDVLASIVPANTLDELSDVRIGT